MSFIPHYFIVSPSGRQHQVTLANYCKIRDSAFEDAGRGRPIWLKDEDPEPFIVGDWRGWILHQNSDYDKPPWRQKS